MFGLTFHPYGLLIGIALVAGWECAQRACLKYGYSFKQMQKMYVLIIVIGFIFARLWHGITDWSLYVQNPAALLYVWNGGLSIIGGIVGGGLATMAILFTQKKRTSLGRKPLTLFVVTDLLVHALPVSQAIGRIGNFVNQELYGLPTNVPWGIYIDPEHRLLRVLNHSHFHPLFLYEIVLNLIIAGIIWRNRWVVGVGQATGLYLVLYGFGRLLLDFLRIDRGDMVWFGFSFNQYVLLVLTLYGAFLFWRRHYHETSVKTGK